MAIGVGATTAGFDVPARSFPAAGARTLIVAATMVAAFAGFAACGTDASAHAVLQAGPDLTRLLRAMAGLKFLMAVGAMAVVWWRLGAAASLPWLAGYTAAGMAMAAGPGLIVSMAHVGAGALLLHAGLGATLVMLWRDPAMGARLQEALARRRARTA
jgi:hypothetical protein